MAMLVYCRVIETICDTTGNMSPSNDRHRETVYLVARKKVQMPGIRSDPWQRNTALIAFVSKE